MKKKRYHYCQSYFIPHPCVGQRQEACRKIQCQKAQKAQNNREWRKKNPHCYRGDYPRVKKWLDNHPGYLKKYRQNHPKYIEKNRKSQSMRDRSKKLCLDIQAELSLQPIEIMFLFSHLLNLDIQADLDRYKPILRR